MRSGQIISACLCCSGQRQLCTAACDSHERLTQQLGIVSSHSSALNHPFPPPTHTHTHNHPQATIEFEPGFVPTCLAHPDTYLNKIVVGGADGRLQLWNFVTATKLHTFAGW